MIEITTIYVRHLSANIWRPVEASVHGEGIYQIEQRLEDAHQWEFRAPQRVIGAIEDGVVRACSTLYASLNAFEARRVMQLHGDRLVDSFDADHSAIAIIDLGEQKGYRMELTHRPTQATISETVSWAIHREVVRRRLARQLYDQMVRELRFMGDALTIEQGHGLFTERRMAWHRITHAPTGIACEHWGHRPQVLKRLHDALLTLVYRSGWRPLSDDAPQETPRPCP